MSDDQYAVVVVYSVSHAVRIEKALQTLEIPCKLIPVPRHLSSDCGVCVRVRQQDERLVFRAIQAAGVEIDGLYPM